MPEELIDVVEQVANNQTLKFPAKIRQVLSIICKFYISKCERCEKELSSYQDKEMVEHSKILDFANHLKLIFTEINSEFDDFLKKNEKRTFNSVCFNDITRIKEQEIVNPVDSYDKSNARLRTTIKITDLSHSIFDRKTEKRT